MKIIPERTIYSDGIFVGDGDDHDQNIVIVNVTDTPTIWWDEALDTFRMNKGLMLPGGSLYLDGGGDGFEDSIRLTIDTDTNVLRIDKNLSGAWQPSELYLGASTLFLGENIGITAAGHQLMTEHFAGDQRHLYAYTEVDDVDGTEALRVLHLDTKLVRYVTQSNESSEFVGTSFGHASSVSMAAMMSKVYIKIGSVAATAPVLVQVFEGTDDTGEKIWEYNYPASDYGPINTEKGHDMPGFLELVPGMNIYTKFSSTANFSLKTNAAVTEPWTAVDMFMLHHDEALTTKEWISGWSYTLGDWFVDHDTRKIYVCNTTGVQTGTFASNSAKWHILGDTYIDSLLTEGSIPFAGPNGKLIEDNDNLFWDNTEKRVGIGTLAPSTILHLKSTSGITYGDGNDTDQFIMTVNVTADPAGQPIMKYDWEANMWMSNRGYNISKAGSGLWWNFADGVDSFELWNRAGSPEGVIASNIGSLCVDTSNGVLYIKTTDTVNTGWKAKLTTETDPVFSAWDKSSGISIAVSQLTDHSYYGADLLGFTEGEVAYGNSLGNGLASIDTFTFIDGKLSLHGNIIVGADGEVNKAFVEDSGNWDAAYTHISNDGSDHSFLDQAVTIAASPVFSKVGIGASPTSLLDISSGVDNRSSINIQREDNTYQSGISFQNSAGSFVWNIYHTGASTPDLMISGGATEVDITNLPDRIWIKSGGSVGLGIDPVMGLHLLSTHNHVLMDNASYPFPTSKVNSQGVAWTNSQAKRTGAVIFASLAQDRPEISWYRGSRSYPEFSIRQHVTNDFGGQIYSGGGVSAPIMTMAFKLGMVGIGLPNPEYALHVAVQDGDSILQLERLDDIIGMGYGVGGILFKAGETTPSTVAIIRVVATEDWTATSSPTRMEFHTTPSGSLNAAKRITILQNGFVGINITDPTELLDVDGTIKAKESFMAFDGSTQVAAATPDGRGWHVTTAVYKQNKDISAQDTSPRDMHFKPDGTKAFISGVQGNGIIWEYDLTIAWDISTLTYNSKNKDIDTYESNPMGLFFRSDGEKMYVCGSGGDEVNQFELFVAWDITSASWESLFDCSAKETQPAGVEFRPDGMKMYIIGTSSDAVNEYDLPIPWDITSAVWLQAYGTSIDAPTGFHFKPDGRKMYVMDGSAEDDIHEYNLYIPWDISTASLDSLFDVSSENAVPQDVAFNHDGTKMYMLGSTSPASVFEYDLGVIIEGNAIFSAAVQCASMTTTERDNQLSPVDGMVIYNETLSAFNFRENGAWVTKTND